MKKKIIFITIIFVVLFSLWYHWPIRINKTIDVCNIDGHTTTITCNVTWRRYFLQPTELSGTIKVDHIIYKPIRERNEPFVIENFISKVKMKIKNETYIPILADENDTYFFDKIILLDVKGIGLKYIRLSVINGKQTYNYFGPANNSKQVSDIAKKF